MRGPGFNPRHLHFFFFFYVSVFSLYDTAETTRLHYSYTSTLGLRTFFVVTKADACDMEDLQKTVGKLKDMIIDNRGVPLEVGREQHVTKAAETFAQNKYVDRTLLATQIQCLPVCSSTYCPPPLVAELYPF